MQVLLENREWALSIPDSREQLKKEWAVHLEQLRAPLRGPCEAIIRRMQKQREYDDKQREKLREKERNESREQEKARVLVSEIDFQAVFNTDV